MIYAHSITAVYILYVSLTFKSVTLFSFRMQGVKALTIMTAMLDLTAMLSNHLSNKFPLRILKNHINETPALLALSIEKLLFIFF